MNVSLGNQIKSYGAIFVADVDYINTSKNRVEDNNGKYSANFSRLVKKAKELINQGHKPVFYSNFCLIGGQTFNGITPEILS